MSVLIKRLNWKQILIHFLAIWLINYSFKLSACLIEIHVFKMTIPGNKPDIWQALQDKTVSWDEIEAYLFFTGSFWLYGLLLGFLISLMISVKKHWFWANTIISACGAYFIYIMPWHKKYSAGWHTTIYTNVVPRSILWYITVAVLCLAAAVWMFFSKRMNDFIAKTA